MTTGKLEGHGRRVSALAFSPDGQVMVSCSWGKTVRLWNVATEEAMRKLKGHNSLVTAVAFSLDE